MSSLQSETSHRRHRHRYGRLIFTLAVTGVAVWFLVRVFSGVGLENISERLMGADPLLVALAVAVTVARFLLLALRWETFVRREAPIGLRQITPVLMAGNFLALVTPALRVAGPILRAYYLSRETGRPRARFYGTIVADQASNFTVWAVAMSLGGIVVAAPGSLSISPVLGASMLAALVGGLSVGYVMLRRVHRGHDPMVAALVGAVLGKGREGGWRARVIRWWEDLVHALATSVIGSGTWWPSLGLSGLVFATVVAVQVLSFAAVGRPISAAAVAFAVAGAGLLQVIVAAPGGAGLTEASLIGVFWALGVDHASAAAAVLLARFINYFVLLPWGGIDFFRLQRRYGMPPDGASTMAA